MNMAGQVQMPVAVRQFTDAEMKRYFTAIPVWAIVVAVIGGLAFLSGLSSGGFMLTLGVILLLIGGGYIAYLTLGPKPTDQEYDAWLDAQAKTIKEYAVGKLGLDQSQIIEEPLFVRGVVLPGGQDASKYRLDEIRWKRGKDGVWRFSINVYTYFFPAAHHLASFVGDVNALNQSAHNEKTDEYFYRDVVGATTEDEQDYLTIKKKQYQYRIQRFALRISSGNFIGVSVGARPADNRQNLPNFTIPNSGLDQTVAQLRMLLRQKKQSNA